MLCSVSLELVVSYIVFAPRNSPSPVLPIATSLLGATSLFSKENKYLGVCFCFVTFASLLCVLGSTYT